MTVSVQTTPLDLAPDTGRLTAMVFELAAQLHQERARRMAVEAALVASGALTPDAVETAATMAWHRQRAKTAADAAVDALIRSTFENPDPRTPLRDL